MCKKKSHMFLAVDGEYISLTDIKHIRNNQFDTEGAIIEALRGAAVPIIGIWGKKRKDDSIVVIDLSVKFNQETLGIEIDNRHYTMPSPDIEAERLMVEEWHRLNKIRKKRKKRLAKKQPK